MGKTTISNKNNMTEKIFEEVKEGIFYDGQRWYDSQQVLLVKDKSNDNPLYYLTKAYMGYGSPGGDSIIGSKLIYPYKKTRLTRQPHA